MKSERRECERGMEDGRHRVIANVIIPNVVIPNVIIPRLVIPSESEGPRMIKEDVREVLR